MKEYVKGIIPRIKRFSAKLDELAMLNDKCWLLINDASPSRKIFIFKKNGQLLISNNGIVEKGKWEYLSSGALLLDMTDNCYLFKHGFIEANLLALKLDGREEYFLFEKEEEMGDLTLNNSYNNFGKLPSSIQVDYQILNKIEGWKGRFTEYEVLINHVYREKLMGDNLNKKFYHSKFKPLIYFDSIDACIANLKIYIDK